MCNNAQADPAVSLNQPTDFVQKLACHIQSQKLNNICDSTDTFACGPATVIHWLGSSLLNRISRLEDIVANATVYCL